MGFSASIEAQMPENVVPKPASTDLRSVLHQRKRLQNSSARTFLPVGSLGLG